MIVETVFGFIFDAASAIVGVLPVSTPDVPSFGPMIGLARSLDGFLPVHEVLDFTLTGVQVILVIFTFKLGVFLYGLIPFKFS